jgi:hypothetical protein
MHFYRDGINNFHSVSGFLLIIFDAINQKTKSNLNNTPREGDWEKFSMWGPRVVNRVNLVAALF